MKKISLSVLAILFAATSLLANGATPVKPAKKAKAKQATCTNCKKDKCDKTVCPKPANCPDKAHCPGM